MTPEQRVWTLRHLRRAPLGRARVWCTPSAADRAAAALPHPLVPPLQDPGEIDTLVVIGGGTLLDEAKVWRADRAPAVRLVAVPSLWGSGAEASPVTALNREGRKVIRVDRRLRPDVRVTWPELAESVPEAKARWGCGDCWAHALEGFLSPLASSALRVRLAAAMRSMLDLPLGRDARWFEASARACALQARSGVGLVHGIAHVLEGPLQAEEPGAGWGHARLCSLFLRPVLELGTDQWSAAVREYGLDPARIEAAAGALFEPESYRRALPALEAHWRTVLRDPCTRTHSLLVRPGHLAHFVRDRFGEAA